MTLQAVQAAGEPLRMSLELWKIYKGAFSEGHAIDDAYVYLDDLFHFVYT